MGGRGGCLYRLPALLAVLLLLAQRSEQYGSGAPPRACEKMLPVHSDIQPQTSAPPYAVRAWAPQVHQGSKLNVTLSSPSNIAIRGFFLQARSVQDNSKILGSWIVTSSDVTKTTKCNAEADSATHTSTTEKSNLVFTWTAPNDFLGAVIIKATVAESYAQFWGGIESTLVEVVTPDTLITTTPPPETTPATTVKTEPTVTSTTAAPVKNDPFYEGCGTIKLCFGSSETCLGNQNCVAAVSILVQGDVYTFELKGTDSPGYVAAGLSADKNMGDDSAMECQQVNGKVTAHTSWTYPKSDPYVSRDNVPQNIIRLISSSYTDGVLSCKFTRDVQSTVRGVNFNLAKDKYHLMVVSGEKVNPNSVGFHSKVFVKTEALVSLSEVRTLAGASKLLLRLHGSFMLIAWIGTASCGILLARYYRQTWVGSQLGGKDIWFAWHRLFMVTTWLLTVASFIIIFVDVGGWGGTGDNPHAITGIITIVLCFLQPIGAFFRPHPNTSKRPIFNWIHWFFGNAAHILGIVTVFFAVYLNKAELPGWTVYILVAFVAFHVIMHLILSVAMCVSDGRISNGRVNSFPMKDLMTNNRPPLNHDRKMDAPHSGFRKLLLGVYYTFIILFVIALVCLVCLAPIEETLESVSKVISGMAKDKN